MLVTRFPRVAALALVLSLGVAGCAGNRATRADQNYVARDVETLYSVAKDRLDRRDYKTAAQLFDEVERQHPYSVWARRAQLMSSFSYYMSRDYQQAILSAQRFLSLHPGNRDAPYAYYLVAISYYEQILGVQRDQKVTSQALDALNELVRRYPNTPYADDARLKIDLARDHLAGKEMEVGRYYQNQAQYLAAAMRFRTVVDDYDTTSHVPEAYLALGIPEEAKKAAAVLGYNYPGSKWYERAYRLVQRHAA
jgi:outer membrane protein assembly factor BamD